MSSLRRARIAAVVVLLLSIVYNVPQFAEREAYEETVGCDDGDVRTRWRTRKTDVFGPSYYVVYKTVCYIVFRAVGPLLVLLVLNARLVLALKRLGQRRRRLDRGPADADDDRPTSAVAGVSTLMTMATPSTDNGNRQRPSATARRRNFYQTQNITLMLVVVVFIFIVCQLPDLGLRIIASLVCLLLILR